MPDSWDPQPNDNREDVMKSEAENGQTQLLRTHSQKLVVGFSRKSYLREGDAWLHVLARINLQDFVTPGGGSGPISLPVQGFLQDGE